MVLIYIPKYGVKAIGTNFGMVQPSSGCAHLPNERKIANLAISQKPVKLET